MVIIVENGHVNITCDGSCPPERPNCIATVTGLIPGSQIPPSGNGKAGGKEDKVKCKISCECHPDNPEKGIEINSRTRLLFSALSYKLKTPNFKTFAGTSNFMLISGIQQMIFSEDGFLDRIVFKDIGQQQSSDCGMVVEVMNGQTKITCEGTCDQAHPYCRMDITILEPTQTTKKSGEPPEEEQGEPSGNYKYKIKCSCKKF